MAFAVNKIHFIDTCTLNENCREKYCCDKRHPYRCCYFEWLGRCKFGTYCEYLHFKNKETKFKKGIQHLKTEIQHSKTKNLEHEKKINDVSKVEIPTNVETNERDKTSKKLLRKQTEKIKKSKSKKYLMMEFLSSIPDSLNGRTDSISRNKHC